MQRKENESFADYKTRRAAANLATKNINAAAKGGGTQTSRQFARSQRNNSKHAGAYGKALVAHFATLRATPIRLATHKQHVMHMTNRAAVSAHVTLLAAGVLRVA